METFAEVGIRDFVLSIAASTYLGPMTWIGTATELPPAPGSRTARRGDLADSIKGIQELVSLGLRFVAVTQNLDTDESNPMARFMLHIMAGFAELEREIIRERVTAGVPAARASGKTLGRPKRVFRRDEAVRFVRAGRQLAKDGGAVEGAGHDARGGVQIGENLPSTPRGARTATAMTIARGAPPNTIFAMSHGAGEQGRSPRERKARVPQSC